MNPARNRNGEVESPNPNLETFRNGQLRAVAAGSRLSFSSTARNYNGTYSAQRQELVESTDGYLIRRTGLLVPSPARMTVPG
ncbi:phage portal protein [Escherichia coli]